MALSDKTNLLVTDYTRQQFPHSKRVCADTFRRVKTHRDKHRNTYSLVSASHRQSTRKPSEGHDRYAVSPWNPTGAGDGLYVHTELVGRSLINRKRIWLDK